MQTSVSIVICTADKPESLSETLKSIGRLTLPTDISLELIVVDNRPQSAKDVTSSFDMLPLKLKYVEEPRQGQAFARNVGLKEAEGDIIVFTDDDLRFSADWLIRLIEPIVSGLADAVAGTVRMAPHLERPWMKAVHRAFFAEMQGPSYGMLTMVGANMCFHRRVLNQVPEFDTNLGPGQLGFADDTLFSYQVAAAGYRVTYSPLSMVEHHFDSGRLAHASLQKHAAQLGRSQAFIAHHWQHRRILFPRLHALRKSVQLSLWRLLHSSEARVQEGMSEGEIYDLIALNFYRQLAHEYKKPRRYASSPRRAEQRANERNLISRLKSGLVKGSN